MAFRGRNPEHFTQALLEILKIPYTKSNGYDVKFIVLETQILRVAKLHRNQTIKLFLNHLLPADLEHSF
jgi:hypothetical protein